MTVKTQYYARTPDGIEEFYTLEEAKGAAEDALEYDGEGWPEGTDSTQWGVMVPREHAVEHDRRETPGEEFDYTVNYKLVTSQPAADGPEQIIDLARQARCFIQEAGESPLPDAILVRAAMAFNMLVRRGWIAGPLDDLALPHAIACIAGSFADHPPSTPQRAAMFAAELGDGT